MLSQRSTFLIASALGLLAVALGAFGAHALKAILTATSRLDTYELAVRYHFYHTLALLATGILMDKYPTSGIKLSALLFFIGIIIFCGSLYTLCLLNFPKIAVLTPIGGVFLIAGWASLFISVLRSSKN